MTADAKSPSEGRLPRVLVAWCILLVLALAVLALRFQRLSELPPGLYFDEGVHGVDALHVLQGEHAVYFPANNGREGLIVYAIALTTSLVGRTLLAVRLPTALASAGTVFLVFWLGQLLFGRDERGRSAPWRGLMVGGVAAGLMAVSIGQTIIGREALRANFLPLLLSLCLALLWWGWPRHDQPNAGSGAPAGPADSGLEAKKVRLRSSWRIALAGVCAGLLPYTYIAARFAPFLFLLFGLSLLLPFSRRKTATDGGKERDQLFHLPLTNTSRGQGPLGQNLPLVAIFLGAAALVAAPILLHFILHPEDFSSRSDVLWVFHPTYSKGEPLRALLENIWTHLLVFGFRGDSNWNYNFGAKPMLNPLAALFFWFGLCMTLFRWRRPAYRLLFLWLGILMLPTMLSRDFIPPPNTLRMFGATPAIYLLTGVGMWEVFRITGQRCLALSSRAERVCREYGTWLAIALGTVIAVWILVQGVSTHRTYFQEWATTPKFHKEYYGEWASAADILNAQPHAAGLVYLLPYRFIRNHGFEYLYQGETPALVIRVSTTEMAHNVESALSAIENLSTVGVVDWEDELSWSGDGDENLVALLDKYGKLSERKEFDRFQIHFFSDISLDRHWSLHEYVEPLSVDYDGGISLNGLALGRGKTQLSALQPLTVENDESLWLLLRWKTAPGLEINYAISLRLHNAEGAMVYQKDVNLLSKEDTTSGGWIPEEPVDTISNITVPTNIDPGDYELRLIVYDPRTLKPTVELDVWEAELSLAQIRVAATR